MAYHPFPSTHWSLVGRAGQASDIPAQRAALTDLLHRYEPALRSYLEHARRLSPADADDVLQGFITDKILDAEIIRHADRQRGKFRSFLLTALQHFMVDQHRRNHTQRRGATVPDETLNNTAAATAPEPLAAFDIAWAREVLRHALAQMQHTCETSNRHDVWHVFDARILRPILQNQPPAATSDLVTALNLADATQVANLLVTAKRMFGRHLRQVIGEYERDEASIDEELLTLRQILSNVGDL